MTHSNTYSIETIFIEIEKTVGKNIIVGVIYRPPNGRIEIFENAPNEILAKIDKENKICYLMGDFNIDLLKSESCDYANRFTEQLFTSSFIPLITKPTRITHHTATLIDNIFTNNIEKLESSTNGIIFSDLSDHLPIVHMCNLNTHKENSNSSDPIYKRVINNSNIKLFTNTIKNIPWEDVLNNTNPTETFDKFSKIYTTAYEIHFPIKCKPNRKNINKMKSPWMTKCIAKSVKKKNKLYKTYLNNPCKRNENLYKNIKIN